MGGNQNQKTLSYISRAPTANTMEKLPKLFIAIFRSRCFNEIHVEQTLLQIWHLRSICPVDNRAFIIYMPQPFSGEKFLWLQEVGPSEEATFFDSPSSNRRGGDGLHGAL